MQFSRMSYIHTDLAPSLRPLLGPLFMLNFMHSRYRCAYTLEKAEECNKGERVVSVYWGICGRQSVDVFHCLAFWKLIILGQVVYETGKPDSEKSGKRKDMESGGI